MTYSYLDFTETMLKALNLELAPEELDNPEAQARLAVAEIERLQACEKITNAVARWPWPAEWVSNHLFGGLVSSAAALVHGTFILPEGKIEIPKSHVNT